MEALVHKKKFRINFTKAKTKSCLSLHYNGDNSFLFVTGKEIFKFKTINGNVISPTGFRLGSKSNEFGATQPKAVSSKGNLYDFSIDYNATDKSDILSIHKYLIVENNIK